MTILELVKQLDTLKRDYKRQIEDLPKSYVRGTEVFQEAVARTKANYETSKEGILEQINQELVKIEAKAETEQKFHDSLTKPTLENLLLKVKDVDQLAVINDIIAATGELDLKLAVKNRIIALDSFDAERRNTKQLVEDFRQALAVSGDSMTFTVKNLASQLSE